MDASLFELVTEYYRSMSGADILKAGAHYLDPVWPVHPQMKYLLLFTALEKLNKEGKQNACVRLCERAAIKQAKARMVSLIAELAREASQTPEQTAAFLIESCFSRTKAGSPYVFAHFLNGFERVWANADETDAAALTRVQLIADGSKGRIHIDNVFWGRMCAVAADKHYEQALPFFVKLLQKQAGCETADVLRACGFDQERLQTLVTRRLIKAAPAREQANHQVLAHTNRGAHMR